MSMNNLFVVLSPMLNNDNKSNNEDTTATTDNEDVRDPIDDSLISPQTSDAPALNYDGNISSHPQFLRWLDQGMTEFAQHQEVQEYTYSSYAPRGLACRLWSDLSHHKFQFENVQRRIGVYKCDGGQWKTSQVY